MPLLIGLAITLVGGLAFGFEGVVAGAVLGAVAAALLAQQRAIRGLVERLDALDANLAGGSVLSAGPAAQERSAPHGEPAVPGHPGVQERAVYRPEGEPEPRTQGPAPEFTAAEAVPPSRFGVLLATAVSLVTRFFTTGNLVVRVGVVVLFFGVAFLLRYAYEHALLPIELRLAGSTLFGVALAGVGWRLRARADTYGLVLQGAGVGILYLTIFAAARMYELVPLGAALFLLVVLVAASCVLAVLQNAQSLAIFATAGGFLAPVLMSTGSGSHVALFSYYALLNAGILAMAWFRHWRWLNWTGFLFTFAIGAFWGYQYYRPEHFATTEPFLVLFFLYYVGVSLLFSRRNGVDLRSVVDGTLVFGTPIIAFALQAALVADMPFGLAYSAAGAAATYTLLALWLKRRGAFGALLGQSFLALGVAFATLAIPFAFDNQRWTAAAWALEGAGLYWVGIRQSQTRARVFGVLLEFFASAAFVSELGSAADTRFVLNSVYLGTLMQSIAGGFTAWLMSTHRERLHRFERPLRWVFVFWACFWWLAGWFREAMGFQPWWYEPFAANQVSEHLFVLGVALSFAAFSLLARRLHWHEALGAGFLLLPLLAICLPGLEADWRRASPLEDFGWIAWPLAGAALVTHLRSADELRLARFWHAGTWWWLAALSAWTAAALVHDALPDSAWPLAAWGAVPLLFCALLLRLRLRSGWPFEPHRASYFGPGMGVMLAALTIWLLLTGIVPADPKPLPYLVIANPLELTQLGILLVAWLWSARAPGLETARRGARIAIGAIAFVWLNLTAARAVHYYAGIDYPIERLTASDVFQATASILWTTIALALMGIGARRRLRPLWVIGAVLLGAVILKLFTVDLSNLGVVTRIVSFLSVGALMLLIGYFAPLPPAKQEEA